MKSLIRRLKCRKYWERERMDGGGGGGGGWGGMRMKKLAIKYFSLFGLKEGKGKLKKKKKFLSKFEDTTGEFRNLRDFFFFYSGIKLLFFSFFFSPFFFLPSPPPPPLLCLIPRNLQSRKKKKMISINFFFIRLLFLRSLFRT